MMILTFLISHAACLTKILEINTLDKRLGVKRHHYRAGAPLKIAVQAAGREKNKPVTPRAAGMSHTRRSL